MGVLVAASYALLLFVAVSGRGGDTFVWLTVIAFSYLAYQDREAMAERIRSYRALLRR
jgi:hypothetical protein